MTVSFQCPFCGNALQPQNIFSEPPRTLLLDCSECHRLVQIPDVLTVPETPATGNYKDRIESEARDQVQPNLQPASPDSATDLTKLHDFLRRLMTEAHHAPSGAVLKGEAPREKESPADHPTTHRTASEPYLPNRGEQPPARLFQTPRIRSSASIAGFGISTLLGLLWILMDLAFFRPIDLIIDLHLANRKEWARLWKILTGALFPVHMAVLFLGVFTRWDLALRITYLHLSLAAFALGILLSLLLSGPLAGRFFRGRVSKPLFLLFFLPLFLLQIYLAARYLPVLVPTFRPVLERMTPWRLNPEFIQTLEAPLTRFSEDLAKTFPQRTEQENRSTNSEETLPSSDRGRAVIALLDAEVHARLLDSFRPEVPLEARQDILGLVAQNLLVKQGIEAFNSETPNVESDLRRFLISQHAALLKPDVIRNAEPSSDEPLEVPESQEENALLLDPKIRNEISNYNYLLKWRDVEGLHEHLPQALKSRIQLESLEGLLRTFFEAGEVYQTDNQIVATRMNPADQSAFLVDTRHTVIPQVSIPFEGVMIEKGFYRNLQKEHPARLVTLRLLFLLEDGQWRTVPYTPALAPLLKQTLRNIAFSEEAKNIEIADDPNRKLPEGLVRPKVQ